MEAGAVGYVLKVAVFDELLDAIKTVRSDQRYLSPQIASTVVADYLSVLETGHATTPAQTLTAKEREVVQLIAEGFSTKEIAFRLRSSSKTIDSHRRNILDKLHLSSLADLIKFAIREGLASIDDS